MTKITKKMDRRRHKKMTAKKHRKHTRKSNRKKKIKTLRKSKLPLVPIALNPLPGEMGESDTSEMNIDELIVSEHNEDNQISESTKTTPQKQKSIDQAGDWVTKLNNDGDYNNNDDDDSDNYNYDDFESREKDDPAY